MSVQDGSLNLMNAVYVAMDIEDWEQLGNQLGLSGRQLSDLRLSNYQKNSRRMIIEVIHLWLRTAKHPCAELFNSAVSNSRSGSPPITTPPIPYATWQNTCRIDTMDNVSTLTRTQALRFARGSGADNWYQLGRTLGVPEDFLHNLLTKIDLDVTEKTARILDMWFKNGRVSWDVLYDAVDSSQVTVYSLTTALRVKMLATSCSEKLATFLALSLKLNKLPNDDNELQASIDRHIKALNRILTELLMTEINVYAMTVQTTVTEHISLRLDAIQNELDDCFQDYLSFSIKVDHKIAIAKCQTDYQRLIRQHRRINEDLAELMNTHKFKFMLDMVREQERKMKLIEKRLKALEIYDSDHLCSELQKVDEATQQIQENIDAFNNERRKRAKK